MDNHIRTYGAPKLDAAQRIRLDLPCCKCGYNLRGQRVVDACPECGETVAETIADGKRPQCSLLDHLLMLTSPAAVGLFATVVFCRWATVSRGDPWRFHFLSMLFALATVCLAAWRYRQWLRKGAILHFVAFLVEACAAAAALWLVLRR